MASAEMSACIRGTCRRMLRLKNVKYAEPPIATTYHHHSFSRMVLAAHAVRDDVYWLCLNAKELRILTNANLAVALSSNVNMSFCLRHHWWW